jgi:hypothetical protein
MSSSCFLRGEVFTVTVEPRLLGFHTLELLRRPQTEPFDVDRRRDSFVAEFFVSFQLQTRRRVLGFGARMQSDDLEVAVLRFHPRQRLVGFGRGELVARVGEVVFERGAAHFEQDVVRAHDVAGQHANDFDDAFAAVRDRTQLGCDERSGCGDLLDQFTSGDSRGPNVVPIDRRWAVCETPCRSQQKSEPRDGDARKDRPPLAPLFGVGQLDIHTMIQANRNQAAA